MALELGEEFEQALAEADGALDLILDNDSAEQAELEAQTSYDVDSEIDSFMEADNDDVTAKAIADDVIGKSLITDDDISDIENGSAKGKDDDDMEKAADRAEKDPEVKAYAKELVESGVLTEEEADAVLGGEDFDTALGIKEDDTSVSDEPGEIFGSGSQKVASSDTQEDGDLQLKQTDPNYRLSSSGDRDIYHDDDYDDDDDLDNSDTHPNDFDSDEYDNDSHSVYGKECEDSNNDNGGKKKMFDNDDDMFDENAILGLNEDADTSAYDEEMAELFSESAKKKSKKSKKDDDDDDEDDDSKKKSKKRKFDDDDDSDDDDSDSDSSDDIDECDESLDLSNIDLDIALEADQLIPNTQSFSLSNDDDYDGDDGSGINADQRGPSGFIKGTSQFPSPSAKLKNSNGLTQMSDFGFNGDFEDPSIDDMDL